MRPMAELSVNVGSARPQPVARGGVWTRRPYRSAALITMAIAMVGFWPTYFGPAVAGTVALPSVIHLHAARTLGIHNGAIATAPLFASATALLWRGVRRPGRASAKNPS